MWSELYDNKFKQLRNENVSDGIKKKNKKQYDKKSIAENAVIYYNSIYINYNKIILKESIYIYIYI